MSELPSTESLRCFLEAARTLNFRRAAGAVHLSPAAFGQRIRQLERQCGAALFHRTTRAVVLTEAGFALLPRARRALEAAEGCLGIAGQPPPQVEVTLGTRHELGLSWVVPALPTLARHHPGLFVHLHFGSGSELVDAVRGLRIDCAVTSSRLTDPLLDSTPLAEERYTFVASPRLLETCPLRDRDEAASHVLIDAGADLPLFRYWREAKGGFDSTHFARVWRVGTIEAIRALVRSARGVAVLPSYYVAADLRSGRLVQVFKSVRPLRDHFRLIYRNDDPRKALLRAVAETLAKQPLR